MLLIQQGDIYFRKRFTLTLIGPTFIFFDGGQVWYSIPTNERMSENHRRHLVVIKIRRYNTRVMKNDILLL